MPETPRSSYRFQPRTLAIVAAIAGASHGRPSATSIIEAAVEQYGRKVLGRRLNDLVPPRIEAGRGRRRVDSEGMPDRRGRRTMPD